MSNDILKFRAWDKKLRLMSPVEMLMHDGSASIYQPVQVSEDGDIDWTTDTVPADQLEIMQWTGLYDCDGEMIWEGDILLGESRPFGEIVGVVEFGEYKDSEEYEIESHFGIHVSGVPLPDLCTDGFKVVGNIYENPELLDA